MNTAGDGIITQRIPPMPGMEPGSTGDAFKYDDGPTIRNKVPTVLAYVLLDLLLFNYATGWAAAATFYGAGSFEMHADAPHGDLAVLVFISKKALLPAGVLVAKDLLKWLNKLRQAHGFWT